jgi:hypothetical protein
MTHKYDISLLLPTRGRTEALIKSVKSVYELADRPHRLQMLFAFDKDDEIGKAFFRDEIQPWLDDHKYHYMAMLFEPLGYIRLHVYNNKLAAKVDADWIVIWNDDAIMETQGWDTEILKYNGKFRLLAFHTHNDHPYSIFPIVPRKWYELLGYISPHPTQDGWLSQQAYMLDIWERIPVHVLHDRHDLTGNNKDETFMNRAMLEGKPEVANDFHSVQQMELRHKDCTKLAAYMRNELGMDLNFFTNVFNGTQDPWEKLAQNDVNGQMVQFANPHSHFKPEK